MILKGECTEYKTDIVNIHSNSIYQYMLRIRIKVTFLNKQDPDKNFVTEFQASRYFHNKNTLLKLESNTIILLVEQLSNEIFNKICADW